MDVSKYRTLFPPKEHEEAVRLLLEGLETKQPDQDLKQSKPKAPTGKREDYSATSDKMSGQYKKSVASTDRPHGECFNSSSSSSSVDSGSLARGSPEHEDDEFEFDDDYRHADRRMGAEDDDDNDDDAFNSEESSSQDRIQVSPQIPRSRLLQSSAARLVGGSTKQPIPRMQSKATSTASDSVSSASGRLTSRSELDSNELNGNYEAIPSRTIAIQCDLKLSSVKRDGVLRTVDSASSDLASMRASSISSTRYGFYKLSPETYEERRQLARSISSRNIAQDSADDDELARATELTSTSSADDEERELERELAGARNERRRHNVRDSLPRRPKTALSYVSTSRLPASPADAISSGRSMSDDEEEEAPRSLRNENTRAMSHQVLASRTNTDQLASDSGNSELADRYRVAHNEEMLLTRRGQQMPVNATRRVSSQQQLFRRSNTLTSGTELDDDDDVQLDAVEQAQRNDARAKLSRYSSMSLARQGPRADRSCNLSSSQIRRAASGNANEQAPQQVRARAAPASSPSRTRDEQRRCLSRAAPQSATTLTRSGQQQARRHYEPRHQLGRSTSMKLVNSATSGQAAATRFLSPPAANRLRRQQCYGDECESSCCEQCNERVQKRPTTKRCESSEDSESPMTRTWANPGAGSYASRAAAPAQVRAPEVSDVDSCRTASRAAARSLSMRDVSAAAPSAGQRFERIYRAHQQPVARHRRQQSEVTTTSEELNSSDHDETAPPHIKLLARATAHHQPLDYDSQQRLNEIGLPAESLTTTTAAPTRTTTRRATLVNGAALPPSSSSSHLGLGPSLTLTTRYATTDRRPSTATRTSNGPRAHLAHQNGANQPVAITGRAMSQQSLTRPTMPLSRRLRRGAGGSQSGASDVGGSSMSLASRMRYENAHTRSPVVMYIPQVPAKSTSTDNIRKLTATNATMGSLLRNKSSRKSSAMRHTSQDRSRKSTSRQGSDSESSGSMLRTLVKPRSSRLQSPGSSGLGMGRANGASGRRRYGMATRQARDMSDDEENMDDIGDLATEIDSYKFRRRYSVPKDAKINWFSKLKQRVTSASRS